jgi:hypothetical protein
MKTSLLTSVIAATLLSLSAGKALAWHDHYYGGVGVGVVVESGYGYGYPGYGYPGYYAPPPVMYAPPPPAYAYPPDAPPVAYAPAPNAPVYQSENGQYCREYTSNINVGGQVKKTYGTACRQPDGQWRMMN